MIKEKKKNEKLKMIKKIINKILLAPINLLVWISHNPAETMLLFIGLFSIAPFFMNVESTAMLGGLMAFFACIAEKYVFKYEKPSKLYNIILLIILIIGVVALFIIGGKEFKSTWIPIENSLATFMGAFWGMMIALFLISFIDQQKEEKEKQREIYRLLMEQQKEQRIISQKEKSGFIAIKKSGKLIGYIEKEKYDEFVNTNIIKN